ncbi:MAG: hypothetical protein GC201_08640 [Alphaproteobacteria bacterium]|nr:hypothetical protein [Alphaproteobacteria bacterium]
MTKLRKFTLMSGVAVALAAAVPVQASAGWHGYHGGWHHHGGGGWIPFAAIGGLAAGMLIASSANSHDRYDRTYYAPPAPPPPAYGYNQPCHEVRKQENVDGYASTMAATMCYDSYGTPYIVQGSQHPVDDGYDY